MDCQQPMFTNLSQGKQALHQQVTSACYIATVLEPPPLAVATLPGAFFFGREAVAERVGVRDFLADDEDVAVDDWDALDMADFEVVDFACAALSTAGMARAAAMCSLNDFTNR